MSNPDIKLEAGLDVSTSRKKIKEDVKKLGNINVPLTGKLNMQKTREQIKKQTSGKNLGTVNLNTNINTKNVTSSVGKATLQAQKQMSAKPLTFSINKDKLINDIKILGQQNSRLFKDAGMTTKYNQLLDSAKFATTTKDLKTLRVSLSAFKSELKATGNAGLTMGDALKKGLTRATELFGSYGLIMMFSRQLRNAWTEARELDASLTDLSKVNDEITRSDFPEYLEKCISKTKELAVATKDYIEAVTTFSRAGYNLADSEILAEKATQLANVGDMSAEDASKTILSGIQAYNEIDGYGIEQLEEKAQALNDKLNEIGNTASISTSELAEGIQAVGSVMNDANTSIDEFIALLGAGNRQVQDSKKVSLAIRTSALRIRSCTTELEEMGEETEGVITSTSELADKIKALTDIDGVGKLEGVSILEDDGKTFRSIFDIYNDISKVYDKMDDTDSSALLKLIAGTHRSSQVSAILNNMAEANEILNNSLNATGSASEEYSKYLESAEAATTRFGVAMTDAYNSVLNGNTVKALANTGTAILDFANEFGLVESTLRGLIAIGILKGIGTLTTAIKGSVVQVTNLGNALNTVKNLNNLTRGTQQYANAMNMLKVSCVGLTDAQLKQVLSNTSLTQSERIKILQYQGLTKAQAQAKLTQLGLTQTTNQQTTANTMATTSTLSLKNAVTGLGASIKASLLSNPIGWAIMAISTAISITTSAISNHNQELEEQRQKTKESADEANTLGDEISELTNKYIQLSEAVKTDSSAKEDLLTTQTELLKKLGLEGKSVDELIEKYGSLSNAIKQASIDSLKNKQLDLISGVDVAREEFLDVGSDGWMSGNNVIDAHGDGAVEAFKELEKVGLVSSNSIGTKGGVLTLTGDDTTVEGILENYKKLEKALSTLRDSNAFTAQELSENPVYNAIYNRYNEMKPKVDAYNSSVADLNENLTQQHMLSALQGRDLPKTKDEFDSFKQSLIDTAIASKDFIGTDEDITNTINNYLATVEEFNKFYETVEKDTTKQLFSSFEGSEIGERLQYLTQQFKDGELTYKEYFDALQNEIDNVDFSNYTDSLDEANKAAQQFFTDSMQQTATGLSDLISKFDEGSISITEYLEGYVSIAETLSSLTDNLQENSASWDKNGEAIDNATSKALDETQSKLDSAISTIASYQDSIYSLEQIMTQSVEVGSDEFNAHAQVIAQDLYNIVQAGGLMADEVANTLGTTTSQIAKSLTENVSNQSLAAQAISANTNTAITNMATAVGELFDSLGDAISNFKVDVTFGVKSITTKTADLGLLGKVQLPAIKFGIEADGESLSAIGDAVSSFGKSVASNFAPQTIDINDYLFGNTETGKNSSYTPSGDILNNYNNALDKIKKSGKGTSQVFDWIENKLKSVQRTITNLGKTVSATWKSWTTRNNALAQQISEVNKEISLQQQAYQKYMVLANGVGLSSYYQNLVKNGTIDISTITNKDLIDQIKAFEDFYNKALDCQDAIVDLEDELVSLAETEFDNVAQQYDDELSLIEHRMNMLDKSIDQLEVNGYLVSKKVYEALLGEEENKLLELQQKYISLQSELHSSGITRFTQKWFELNKEISSTKEAILESRLAIDEFEKTIMELDWEVFDKIQDMISSVTTESNFLIDLMSNGKLVDDKGAFTDIGKATIGLHTTNYETYKSQIEDYTKAIEELDKQFTDDSLDQNYLERRRELVELVQDSVLSLEDEKQSIKSLWSDGYGKLLDYMQELIDKRLNLQNSTNSLFDYQKNVKDQVEEISRLQNILNSYGNDNSEEAKMLIQKYQVELDDAQETLEETMWQQQLKEEEKLLTSLMDSASEWQNQRLDNIEGLIQSAIDNTNTNASTISDTLKEVTGDVGYALSEQMQSIWDGTGKNVVGDGITTVNTTLTDIKNLVAKMVSDSNAVADSNVKDTQTSVTPTVTVTPTVSKPSTASNSSSNDKVITVGSRINASGALIYRQANGTKGYHQFYDESPYYVVIGQKGNFLKVRHQSLSSGTTGWFKKSDVKAYATGGKVDYTGLAMVHGSKSKPELMLNAKDTENFIALKDALSKVAQTNMFDAIQSYANIPNVVPNMNNQSSLVHNGDIQVILPDVQTPEDFAMKFQYIYDMDTFKVRTMINEDVHSKYGSHNYRKYLRPKSSIW